MPLFKKTIVLLLLLLLQSSVGITGAAMALEVSQLGVIQQGVSVKGIMLGGLTPVEAARKLENALPASIEKKLELKDPGRSYFINLSDIDGRYDCLSTAEEALAYCKKGYFLSQLAAILKLRAAPVDLPIKITFSDEKLVEEIKSLQKEWEEQPKDAKINFSNKEIIIIPEVIGYSLDIEETLNQARLALASGKLYAVASGRTVRPNLTSEALEGNNSLLAEYTTTFDESAVNRSKNIALASAAVNGTFLKPGEVFSLNHRLGPRLAETGYLKAPVFIGNELALDIGGGICQVATTLYNAVLLSNLEVKERYSHPSPVGYAPLGRDATIAGDYLDLKFTNNMSTPIYISSKAETGTLTIHIFGTTKNNGRTVRITSEKTVIEPRVVITYDNTLSEGEVRVERPGVAGHKTQTYREVVVGDHVESKALISTDYYEPIDKVIRVSPIPVKEGK